MSPPLLLPAPSYRPDDYYLFPFWFLFYLLGLHVLARALEALLDRLCPRQWKAMDRSKQANVITYVLELLLTPTMLVISLVEGARLLGLSEGPITQRSLENLEMVLSYLCGLYTFELLYRPATNLPLATHHLVTIILAALMTKITQEDGRVQVVAHLTAQGQVAVTSHLEMIKRFYYPIKVAIVLSFHATTEQPTFIGT